MKNRNFIDRSVKSVNLYLKAIRKIPVLSPEEEMALWEEYQQGNEHAFDKLVESNLRYVITCVKCFQSEDVTLEDLVSSGNESLIKAARNFDPSRGVRLIGFAKKYILGEAYKLLEQQGKRVKTVSIDTEVYDDGHMTLQEVIPSKLLHDSDYELRYDTMYAALRKCIEDNMFPLAADIFDDCVHCSQLGLGFRDVALKYKVPYDRLMSIWAEMQELCRKEFRIAA